MLFKSLLKCSKCGHAFKGRNERGIIKYRCNNRLKNGQNACSNNSAIAEEELLLNIKKQFGIFKLDFRVNNDFFKVIINDIVVEPENSYTINFKDPNLKSTIIRQNKCVYGTLT